MWGKSMTDIWARKSLTVLTAEGAAEDGVRPGLIEGGFQAVEHRQQHRRHELPAEPAVAPRPPSCRARRRHAAPLPMRRTSTAERMIVPVMMS